MAEEEVAAVVADNGSGTCNTEFAGGRGRRESKRERECAKLHHTPHTPTAPPQHKQHTHTPPQHHTQHHMYTHTPPTPHTTPHVHTQNTTHHTHHTTYQATDRDLESVFNVNAWICACQTQPTVILRQKKVNVRICAQSTVNLRVSSSREK